MDDKTATDRLPVLGRVTQWFNRRGWADITICVPFVWMTAFFLVPFVIVVGMSFALRTSTSPPFSFGSEGSWLSLKNYARLWTDDLYYRALATSLENAAVATIVCLLIGYPMALALTRVLIHDDVRGESRRARTREP